MTDRVTGVAIVWTAFLPVLVVLAAGAAGGDATASVLLACVVLMCTVGSALIWRSEL